MKFWLYMITVILSLPKSMVFVALGTPSSEGTKATKYGKVVAIGVVVAITSMHPCSSFLPILPLLIVNLVVFASVWIRKKMVAAIKDIEAERAMQESAIEGDEELDTLNPMNGGDTSYKGANAAAPYSYQGEARSSPYQPV
jgi:hypothetical protein